MKKVVYEVIISMLALIAVIFAIIDISMGLKFSSMLFTKILYFIA